MDIKIICREENYNCYKKKLELAGFQVVDEANLVLKETDYQPKTLLGRMDKHYEQIPVSDIYLVESFGRDIFAYTQDGSYQIKYKLYEIEHEYENLGFIRINKSQIVNKNYIHKIKPLLNSRIKIVLKTKQVLETSRIYQEHFREIIGF